MRKFLQITAMLLLVSMLLVACNHKTPADDTPTGNGESKTDNTTAATEPTTEPTPEPAELLELAKDGKSDYTVVYASGSSAFVSERVKKFISDFRSKTGVALDFEQDTAAPSDTKEIVFNGERNRPDVALAMKKVSYTGFEISVVGNRIIVCFYSELSLRRAIGYLEEAMVKDGTTWGIPSDFHKAMDYGSGVSAPKYETAKGYFQGVYPCANNSYEISTSNTTQAECHTYLEKLAAEGFTRYAENTINQNEFYTYRKGDTNLFVSWYPSMATCKVVAASGYLPSTEKPAVTKTVTPSITQPGRNGVNQNAPGMSYVIQLSDASFIIIDGGPYDEFDVDALMDFLEAKTPGTGKPVIAAWMITHAHGDHMALANSFLDKYHSRIDLRMAAYNFPDFSSITIPNESPAGCGSLVTAFTNKITKYFPSADQFVFHTGQKLYLADAEIEFLFTHEDLYPKEFSWGNHTSSAWRIKLGGKTIMILGDCEKTLCQQMADCFGSELKADILQLSHHGFNGACLDLYKAIDPDICFWACDVTRFDTDGRCLGTKNGYDFNKWLRDDSVKVRRHYHSSTTTTIELK